MCVCARARDTKAMGLHDGWPCGGHPVNDVSLSFAKWNARIKAANRVATSCEQFVFTNKPMDRMLDERDDRCVYASFSNEIWRRISKSRLLMLERFCIENYLRQNNAAHDELSSGIFLRGTWIFCSKRRSFSSTFLTERKI